MTSLPKNRFLRGGYLMLRRYLNHNVAIQSAALAFYLLFTIFPLLIFLNALLGLMHLDFIQILENSAQVFPKRAVEFAKAYLNYVGKKPSMQLMLFGLFFSIYFPMRATNTLMRAARTAYHLGPPRAAARHILKTLLYTLLLIVSLAAMLTLLTVGNLTLDYGVAHLNLSVKAAEWWSRLRFPLVMLLMYFALYVLYAMAQDTRQPQKNLFPGAAVSLQCWILVSLLYSIYIEKFAAYSVLYGSIGTVIALLVWLYLTGTVLILGAELNGTLISLRKDSKNVPPQPPA